MKEFFKVVRYQEACQQIIRHFPAREREYVPLNLAFHRVLAAPLVSPEPLPAFHRSTVDGYAIAARDSFGSSESIPAFLNLMGEIPMGRESSISLKPGQCAWIPTGAMLPPGADAVVMVEYTEKLGDDKVLVYRPVAAWENVMQKGEDVEPGQALYGEGQKLRSQDVGFLASLGFSRVEVFRPYQVGVISTGDEIVGLEEVPAAGQVRDVNSYALNAAILFTGNNARNYPLVQDDRLALKAALGKALAENQLVLMSGGSSVGIKDMSLDVLMAFPGADLLFHGIAVKPGKPTLAVKIGERLVVGLPGHPVSALMIFLILCVPALLQQEPRFLNAVCSENIASQPGRDDFIPVRLTRQAAGWIAEPLLGKSGLMSILSRADAYIHIDYEQQGLRKGEQVKAFIFD